MFNSNILKKKCVDGKFSKPFKSNLSQDAIYNFVSSITEEIKYCSDVMKTKKNYSNYRKIIDIMKILRTLSMDSNG